MIREMQEGRRLSWSNNGGDENESPTNKSVLKNNGNLVNMSPSIDKIKESPYISLEDKKKFTVNDIIKDARKDTKHLVPSLQPLVVN
jgi:hypothetical protein